MRATLADVVRRPSLLGAWWYETPWRHPRNVWTLLTEPGRGWLRWKDGTYSQVEPVLDDGSGPSYEYGCDPPLRRLALYLANPLRWLLRGGGWVRDGEVDYITGVVSRSRHRLSWREWSLTWAECWRDLADPEWPDSFVLSGRPRRRPGNR